MFGDGNRADDLPARCGNKRNAVILPAASRFPSRFHAKQSREFVPRPAIIPPCFRLSREYSPRPVAFLCAVAICRQVRTGTGSGTVKATGNRPPLRLCSRQIKPRQGLSNLIKRNAGLFSEGSATGNRPTARAARCGNKRNPAASRFPSRFHAKQSREFDPRPAIIPPAFRLSRVYSPRRLLPPADSRLISPIPA